MGTSPRGELRVALRINPVIWQEEEERLNRRSAARTAAEREHRRLLKDGVTFTSRSQTPPVSERPYGFVLSAGRDDDGLYVELVAFGIRHPPYGTRSVYERAHKRLHGRYPDQ
jgi:hypothetical protein